MEQPPLSSRQQEEPEFDLKEWTLRTRISRENMRSRRFSASNLKSFREDTRSFRSNITISSTTSSPGYALREIDPSTYSFTTALKALQARSIYTWECSSPDGFALNSKWNEAEKYICNPVSGEVPMECLSANALGGRSFRHLTSRITMSAPLIYQSQPRLIISKPYVAPHNDEVHIRIPENKLMESISMTRDAGTQSTPNERSSSSSPAPAPTPPIEERSLQRGDEKAGDSPNCNDDEDDHKLKFEEEVEYKEKKEREDEEEREKNKCGCSKRVGCLSMSWRNVWTKKKHRPKNNNNNICLYHVDNRT